MNQRYRVLISILLLVFLGQCVVFMIFKSPTFDEPNWLAIGWYITHYWTWQGDYHVFMHPPLTFYLHNGPLRLLEWLTYDPDTPPPAGEMADEFPYPYASILPYDTVFLLAKLCMLPVSLLLMAYVYRWAVELHGRPAGVLALGLYAFNPWLIAQAAIIGTDLAIACGMFVTLYSVWRCTRQPSLRNAVITGVAFGLALLTRVSAVFLLPLGLVSAGAIALKRFSATKAARHDSENTHPVISGRAFAAGSVLILGIALLVVEAGYLFDVQPVRAFRPEQEQDMMYRLFHETPIPLGAYINSIRLPQSFLFWMERSAFLAGQHLTSTVWYANALAFLFKNPVPFLLLLAASLAMWRQWRFEHAVMVLLPAGVLFLIFSLWFPVQGFRFVLPIYPFLIVWMSRVAVWDALQKPVSRIVFGALLGWYIVSGVTAMPDYLAYCNELIGGTAQGHHWFADADYDWGQDLKRLGRALREYDGPPVRLAYFGSAIPEYYGIQAEPLSEPEGCRPTAGLLAISATRLNGVYAQNHDCYAWLSEYEPLMRIGGTLFVYAIHSREIPGS